MKLALWLAAALILLQVAVALSIAYVLYHFIMKFW
jgi:hypothetical protein